MSGYSSSFARLNISSKYGEDVVTPTRVMKNGRSFGEGDGDSDILRLWEFGGGGVQIKEADIGQPCTECSKCKDGYEPHKWRKTCKHCKCSKDGHEIVAEHGARSRLGFVATHDGLDARSLGYTFVPPGLTSARQVDQYYSTLPSEEVPKLGSKGETNRSQRIVRQLPKQDLSLSACKFVEPQNQASYE
ncbi:prickle planar cell polarity protein 3-like, partial [Diabrotica undecimpunctata]